MGHVKRRVGSQLRFDLVTDPSDMAAHGPFGSFSMNRHCTFLLLITGHADLWFLVVASIYEVTSGRLMAAVGL